MKFSRLTIKINVTPKKNFCHIIAILVLVCLLRKKVRARQRSSSLPFKAASDLEKPPAFFNWLISSVSRFLFAAEVSLCYAKLYRHKKRREGVLFCFFNGVFLLKRTWADSSSRGFFIRSWSRKDSCVTFEQKERSDTPLRTGSKSRQIYFEKSSTICNIQFS